MSLEHYLSNPANPTVCDLFKAGAKDTWARIYFSRKTPRLKVHETSISQNLVYEMNLIKNRFPSLDFELFESADEKAHGDDLELSVRHADGSIYTYAIQSKIIYHRRSKGLVNLREGYYKKLKHWVGKGGNRKKQVDLLLEYSRINGFIPLYLLYNYVSKGFDPTTDAALNGCTVIGAQYLKDHHTSADGNLDDKVKFSDLHMLKAFPWHELICVLPKLSKEDLEKRLLFESRHRLQIEAPQNLLHTDKWKKLDVSYPVIIPDDEYMLGVYGSSKDRSLIKSEKEDKIPLVFSPKYKIVVGTSNENR